MGEMADWIVDNEVMNLMDMEEAYRRGEITEQDAYELGLIDELGGDIN
jgi:ClpP class serine protease